MYAKKRKEIDSLDEQINNLEGKVGEATPGDIYAILAQWAWFSQILPDDADDDDNEIFLKQSFIDCWNEYLFEHNHPYPNQDWLMTEGSKAVNGYVDALEKEYEEASEKGEA